MLNPAQTDTGLSDYWIVEQTSVSLTLAPDTYGLFENTISISKTGYTPVGVVGYAYTRDDTQKLTITGLRVSGNYLVISGVDKRASHGFFGGFFVLWQKS